MESLDNLKETEILYDLILELESTIDKSTYSGLYEIDILPRFKELCEKTNLNFFIRKRAFVTLLLEGKIYTNADITKIASFKVNEEFETHQEIIKRLYSDYTLAADFTIKASENMRCVKFSDYVSLLKSKAKEAMKNNSWIFEGDTKFLDKTEEVPKIAYISFQRSGNSFFRKYFESITNITVGMDVHLHQLKAIALQLQGLKGQTVVDDSVWMVTTHSPKLVPPSHDFMSNKGLVIVRNPIDVMVSYFVFVFSNTQNKNIKNRFHLEAPEYWTKFAKHFFDVWVQQHQFWINKSKETKYPIYFMRYEDLLDKPQEVLDEVFRFCLGMDSIQDTAIQKRINEVLIQGQEASVSYKPRSGGYGKNDKYYNDDILTFMKDKGEELLYFFGYTNVGDNKTAFFKYDEHKETSLNNFNGFKSWNNKALDFVSKNQEESVKMRILCDHVKEPFKVDTEFPGWDCGLKIDIID